MTIYKEYRDVAVKNGAAIARYLVRFPTFPKYGEIEKVYEAAANEYRRFAASLAFKRAVNSFEKYSAAGGASSDFPTRQYLFLITVTSASAEYISILCDVIELWGKTLKSFKRSSSVWNTAEQYPMTLKETLSALKLPNNALKNIPKKHTGFYIKNDTLTVFSITSSPKDGERQRDIDKHVSEYRISLPPLF